MLALTILGNNSAVPAFDRHPTAQVLHTQEDGYLIDCGEGTQIQMSKYKIRRNKINHIFISHLHGDHYFGLIALLSSMNLAGRTQELHLYGPPALEDIIKLQMQVANNVFSYPFYFHPIIGAGEIMNNNKLTVTCFPVKHRIECWGFLFREKKNPRKIDPERARSYEIPTSYYDKLQQGFDYTTKKGTIIPNSEVTVAASAPKSYAYCADTKYDESLAEIVKHVDLLYHESTYLKAHEDKAAMYFHSTTTQAAAVAKLAGVKKLLLGHFSSKYESLDDFLSEAKEVFDDTELAIEGVSYKL
ncbi:ribonuclease Z [Ferruginibacter sp. SUN002]|uniref:ribonuclease Z n=1 Tax=Ferruginibacter sp. SUN002 TaxID=2937789 RepID=UPI003D36F032